MRELVLLASSSSSSIFTPPNPSPPHHHHRHYSSKPKTKVPSPSLPKPVTTLHSSSPLLSTAQTLHHNTANYLDLAAQLADDGLLHEFVVLAESVIASGVEASQFFAGLNAAVVAKGIFKNLRQRNVEGVVEVLKRVHQLGLPPLKLFDAASLDLLRIECLNIVNFGDLDEILLLMETLAGFSFKIKELVEPSRVIKICVYKRNPLMAVRFAKLFPHEGILICSIIKNFGKKGDLESALVAYEAYSQNWSVPNMYVCRAIIDVCGLCGDYMKSRYIYEDMLNQKLIPNVYVFNSLMNVNAHDLGYTMHLYKKMQNIGVSADMTSYNILLKSCSVARKVDLAQEIYREAKQLELAGLLKLDDFTYCTIIKIFADAKLWQLALKVKEDMLSSGITPSTFTWSSLMSSCANVGLVEQAIKLFEEMILAGCSPNAQCCNILIHACVEACQYDRAFRLFHTWKGGEVQDTDTFSEGYINDMDGISSAMHAHRDSIITVQNLASNSLHLCYINKLPFTPSLTTYNTLMKACGSDYNRAKALMDEMETLGLSPNRISWSILIDICGSSGNMDGAIQILKNMRMAGVEPDVIAYTTAIKVCVQSKFLKMAFSLFVEMKRYQIKPNLVTYDTLLRNRTGYGSLKEVQQYLAIYQDMRKAGYKSNDSYLKQLIEEWCEGVIQDNYQCQDELEPCKSTDLGRPHSLLLEKVAAHLHNNVSESLSIDLQGLTKVEARIVVLAVLRMVKENYILGHSVKDDMWITLGIHQADVVPATKQSELKKAIFQLLQNELGLEVRIAVPGSTTDLQTDMKIPVDSHQNLSSSFETDQKIMSSPRRPIVLQRLKVSKNSLLQWLQRRVGENRR
ncbi:pentatricopeptide repeat-containing protein At5g02830, chloroplastic [Mercurialis annua]|uniref:pentatricopeptide repeat-containing protein At5g02830, chloroplastic n=1 Tax=Mercurialis annua TaxID=3986 RepID=UPI00215F1E4A|nr:pentatricopeptide repeat-containing protein At5g02830, chloroplastic [Mercurialis annua]